MKRKERTAEQAVARQREGDEAVRDYMDDERDRRMDEMYARQSSDPNGGDWDDIIEFGLKILGVFILILAVAGLLDNQFGWGLTDWIWGLLYSWTDGVVGQPN